MDQRPLPDDEIRVWCADPVEVQADHACASARAITTGEERERLQRFVFLASWCRRRARGRGVSAVAARSLAPFGRGPSVGEGRRHLERPAQASVLDHRSPACPGAQPGEPAAGDAADRHAATAGTGAVGHPGRGLRGLGHRPARRANRPRDRPDDGKPGRRRHGSQGAHAQDPRPRAPRHPDRAGPRPPGGDPGGPELDRTGPGETGRPGGGRLSIRCGGMVALVTGGQQGIGRAIDVTVLDLDARCPPALRHPDRAGAR